ncbi:TauD/TfdA dioxygenase family protein [Paenibacillus sp. FSL W7-1287]|uniref:TauD/TfdA dioxygenase family protein n=1 Tax=Paenibacillus sp. FSL W7-1287 TaxID=2954538 RepID=UPI0030FD1BFC
MSTTTIEIVKKAGRIGAEIRGVKLSADLDQETFAYIQEALKEHLVLFFRGQQHLDDVLHEKFAERLGELYVHPTVPVKENTNAIFELNSEYGAKANTWHTDVTFVPEVPRYSVLRGVTIPSVGGDTVWANTHTAYEDIPAELKALAEQVWAIHSNKFDYAAFAYLNQAKDKDIEQYQKYREVFSSTEYETRHPLVFTHPETGKKHLLLGGFIRQLEGYSTSESNALYNILQSYVTRLENTVRWNWQEGDLVIWDNLATQHYAVADYEEKRVVRRVTVSKSTPKNVEGEASSLIRKK